MASRKKLLCSTRPSKPQCLGRSRLLYGLCRMCSFRFALPYALCAMLVFGMLGCQATLSGLRPPLVDEGEIYLYLQPYPQEAERLRFSIEGISAVGADGREFPFEISLREIKASSVRRQRLLASGRVPPGSYVGLSVKVKKAILKVGRRRCRPSRPRGTGAN